MNISDVIAELLPIAESLFSLIDKIKTQAPDAWASVSSEYTQAAQAWENAKLSVEQTPAPTANPTPAPDKIPTPDAAPSGHGLTTAEQVAAGLPPANYTR